MRYNLYRAPDNMSLLILFIDGTGSMQKEYHQIVETYHRVFDDFNECQKIECQWTKYLLPLLPFSSAVNGNITAVFSQLFQQFLSGQFPKKITIMFVSDGREVCSIDQIRYLIHQVKEKYQLQIISIEVGDQFPNSLSDALRSEIQQQQIPSQFTVERSSRKTYSQICQDFYTVFSIIKNVLPKYEIHLNEKVTRSIASPQWVEIIQPRSFFLAESQKQISFEGEILSPSFSSADLLEFISNSLSEALFQYGQNKSITVGAEFHLIYETIQQLLQQNQGSELQDCNYQVIAGFMKIIKLIAENKLELQQLTLKQLSDFSEALTAQKFDKIDKIIEFIMKDKSGQLELSPEIINNQLITEFKILREDTLKNSTLNIKQPSMNTHQIRQIVVDTLKNYLQLFQKTEQELEYAVILKNLKDVISKALISVFELEQFLIKNNSEIEVLDYLNNLLKEISELTQGLTKNQIEKFIQQKTTPVGFDPLSSIVIFHISDSYSYLPKSVQFSIRQDEDKLRRVFIVIFDQNQSMQQDYDAAVNAYLKAFQSIDENLHIELVWKNQLFSILNNDGQQGMQFDQLVNIFDSLEDEYSLQDRRISLCVVTDGKTDYSTLHKQIKVAKLQKYCLRLIYVAVGIDFKVEIERNINEKFQSYNVFGKPLLECIPRQLKSIYLELRGANLKKSNNVNQFMKVFCDLSNKFVEKKI